MENKDTYDENAKTEPWVKRFYFLLLGCLILNTILLMLGYILIHNSAGHQLLDELMEYDGIRQVSADENDYHDILKAVDEQLAAFNESKQQASWLADNPDRPESPAEPSESVRTDIWKLELDQAWPDMVEPETASPAESTGADTQEQFFDWIKEGVPRDGMLNNSFINVEISEDTLINGGMDNGTDSQELKLKFSRSSMQSIMQQEGIIYIQIRIPNEISEGSWNGTVSIEGMDITSGSSGAVGIYKNSIAVAKFQSAGQREEKEVNIEYEGGDYIGIKFDITLSGGEFQCILTQE